MKRYFDVLIIVPLGEEFDACLNHFEVSEDLSRGDQLLLAAGVAGSSITVLLAQQGDMGKTENIRTSRLALNQFSFGVMVCAGIAGALSSDLWIGDVCFSGAVVDVLDNVKVAQKGGKVTVKLSPEHYETPRKLSNVLRLNRVVPDTRPAFEEWRTARHAAGLELLPQSFTGKDGKAESLRPPSVKDGLIACGNVSGSPDYNEAVRGVDRRVLAIETESGGMFEVAKELGVPAITVRGISDYAGVDKNRFEEETNNQARGIAAQNVMSFLALQLTSSRMAAYLDERRRFDLVATPELPLPPRAEDILAAALEEQHEAIDVKLRELASGYELLQKGYRLPVPRIRMEDARGSVVSHKYSAPIELRDALKDNRVITLSVPREYPDHSLSWIIANDLLSAEIDGKVVIPVVIEAKQLQRPRTGFSKLTSDRINDIRHSSSARPVFIIDDVHFAKKTRIEFLIDEIKSAGDASVVVVTRSSGNLIAETNFNHSVNAVGAKVCEISFSEITYFIQKNFELGSHASEVLASRLRDVFQRFQMPTHPAYFAGIPKSLLNDLLKANRRAELIELAVAGYLSFVVSADSEPVPLSRTMRERFLSDLAYEINVEKRQFTESDLVAKASALARQKDLAISPAALISSFSENGIIHYVDGCAVFTLSFMESFLLAKRLREMPDRAAQYFEFQANEYDDATFALYAELGIAPAILTAIEDALDQSITDLDRGEERVLIGDKVKPALLVRQADVEKIEKNLQDAIDDVRRDKETTAEKQRLLDAAERVQETFSERKAAESREIEESKASLEQRAMNAWDIATNLLGSGAEQLDADVKRRLLTKLLRLTASIIEDWTRQANSLNFDELRGLLLKDADFIQSIAKSASQNDRKDAERLIGLLVDVAEFLTVTEPFRMMVGRLCEEARDKVLAESLANVDLTDDLEVLLKYVWLADLDVPRGKPGLDTAIKGLKNSRMLRVALTHHLVWRVFWRTWRKADRQMLLDSANEALRVIGKRLATDEIDRLSAQSTVDSAGLSIH